MGKYLWKSMLCGLKSNYDKSQWTIGEWRELPIVTELCVGFNASERIINAMSYVIMEILAKVEVEGQNVIGRDKQAWQKMRVVAAWEWPKEESVKLAIFAAELVIGIYEEKYPNDDRPRKAIEAAREYLKNPDAADAADAARAADAAVDAGTLDKIEAYIQSRIAFLPKYIQ
jgi:hypothetical protein